MSFEQIVLIGGALAMVFIWSMWIIQIGFLRATLAAACRIAWVAPVVIALFPETTAEKLPKSIQLSPVHVLIDDSQSMQVHESTVAADLQTLKQACARFGCAVKETKLSDLAEKTSQGFTPLADVLDAWVYQTGTDPWLLLSDGGDWQPSLPWSQRLRGRGRGPDGQSPRALLVGYGLNETENIWIDRVAQAPFAFHEKPISLNIHMGRSRAAQKSERVQVQVIADEKVLATVNATFRENETGMIVNIVIPPLPRGQHLLQVRALPTGDETILWDNERMLPVEVLPNTVGVLHLLGAPSWDGRFLRRYLKAEPKYDLISFFILRDPWDSMQVSERELSLIPFPVERLFKEELPNFRVVIIQNFALFQFLQQEFQENLVQFVKNGGGLLFLGGPRALQGGDLTSSVLGDILPFKPPANIDADSSRSMGLPFGNLPGGRSRRAQVGPYYDENLAFTVSLGKPNNDQQSLAEVFNDWQPLASELAKLNTLKGMHRTDKVSFKEGLYTPLLEAKAEDGRTLPLAVASYPGRGRAVWLFSDSIWKYAMAPSSAIPRQSYHQFIQAAMTWLMREELKKPLIADAFSLRYKGAQIFWEAMLKGAAAKYFRPGPDWSVTVCGQVLTENDFAIRQVGNNDWHLSGQLDMRMSGGDRCRFEVGGFHKAFGSVKAARSTILPKTLPDQEVGVAAFKLEQLAKLTGAKLLSMQDNHIQDMSQWIENVSGSEGVALPDRFRSVQNHYWMLSRWWIWLLLLMLPLEIIIRRWHQLIGTGSRPTSVS